MYRSIPLCAGSTPYSETRSSDAWLRRMVAKKSAVGTKIRSEEGLTARRRDVPLDPIVRGVDAVLGDKVERRLVASHGREEVSRRHEDQIGGRSDGASS